jgi:serine/threonine-protein kinase
MARRNWKLARADRVGAFHIALAAFILQAVAWVGRFHPVADASLQGILLAAIADWLLGAAMLWFAYLALEPEIRARWPHAIVTWNRVLAGRWMDPQVGSDILIGAAMGSGLWVFFKCIAIVLFKTREPSNWDVALNYFLGSRQWVGSHAANATNALSLGLFIFLTIFGMRHVFRKDLLAALAAAVLFTLAQGEVRGSDWWAVGLLYLVIISGLIFALLRFGLVTTIAAVFFVDGFNAIALGADWNAWYVPASLATALLFLGIAIFAFWRSLGGRELLEGAP